MPVLSTMKGQFPCSKCNKILQSKSKLQIHREIHDNLRPFACEKCEAAFKTNQNLIRHLNEVHAEEDQYPCPLCVKKFKCEDYLNKHMKGTHADGRSTQTMANSPEKKVRSPVKKVRSPEKKVRSPGKKKSSPKKKVRSPDTKVRSPEKKVRAMVVKDVNGKSAVRRLPNVVEKKSMPVLYECDVCHMSFTLKRDLRADILSHLKEKELLMRRSYQRAYSRYGLRAVGRYESSSGEEEYECDLCGRTYKTKLELIEHGKRMHSGNDSPKKYPCPLCDRVYAKAFNLKAHQEYRHELLEGNGYSCDHCGVHLTYKVNMENHIKHANCFKGW